MSSAERKPRIQMPTKNQRPRLSSRESVGPTVYSVEAALLSAVGYLWLEGCRSLTGTSPQLDTLAFTLIPMAALANLALSTLLTTKAVQLVFMSLVMGLTAAYVYTLTEALTPVPTLNQTTTPRDKAYVNSYLGGMTLFQPFAAISLAILCVLTLVAAAPVSRSLWDTQITGPTIMICTLLVTPLWQCYYWFIVTLGVVACLETAMGNPWATPLVSEGGQTDSLTKVLTVPGVWAIRIILQLAGLFFRALLFIPLVTSLDTARTAPLVAAWLFVGIPVFVSAINIVRSFKTALRDLGTQNVNQAESEGDSASQEPTVTGPSANAPFRYESAPPLRQSAFFTTEAALFRQTEASAMWNPKKTT